MNSLTDLELQLWSSYIKSVCGNQIDKNKSYLVENRLLFLAQETASLTWQDLFYKVKNDISGKLKRKVIDAITTNETSFFRDTSPFQMVSEKIMPEIINARRKTTANGKDIPIRIWSAASSTGQELYSTAIVVKELLGNLNGYDIRLIWTDISDRVVAQASYAKYNKIEIERGMSPEKLARYFVLEGDVWKVRDEVRAMATFKTLNLLEPFYFPYKFDLIFCRNVAIYFNEEDKKRLYCKISEVLAPDGFLIIGSTESLSGVCDKFQPVRHNRSVYYQLIK